MTNSRAFSLALLSGGLFYVLFYQQSQGINLFLWGLSLTVLAHVAHPHLHRSAHGRWVTAAFIIALFEMLLVHSSLAFTAVMAGFVILAGTCAASAFPSLYHFVLQGFVRLTLTSTSWLLTCFASVSSRLKAFPLLRWLNPLYLIPAAIGGILLLLLTGASPLFAGHISAIVGHVLSFLSKYISLPEAIILLLMSGIGAVLAGALLAPPAPVGSTHVAEASPTSADPATLEMVSRLGLATLGIVNGLLLIYNIGDIDWIWFNFYLPNGVPMSQLVHEGTYFLIASILLSVACLLVLFQPAYLSAPQRAWLVRGATLWLVQNFILVISVCLRSYRYIDVFGLAYKRIGVIFFLLLTISGLITLAIMIYQRKRLGMLLSVNSIVGALLWLGAAAVDWDGFILRHNLAKLRHGHFDTEFHFTLSDHQLPLLIQNEYQIDPVHSYQHDRLTNRAHRFMEAYESTNWLSWNPRSATTYRQLKAMPLREPKYRSGSID